MKYKITFILKNGRDYVKVLEFNNANEIEEQFKFMINNIGKPNT